jgi:hypothetical protein
MGTKRRLVGWLGASPGSSATSRPLSQLVRGLDFLVSLQDTSHGCLQLSNAVVPEVRDFARPSSKRIPVIFERDRRLRTLYLLSVLSILSSSCVALVATRLFFTFRGSSLRPFGIPAHLLKSHSFLGPRYFLALLQELASDRSSFSQSSVEP